MRMRVIMAGVALLVGAPLLSDQPRIDCNRLPYWSKSQDCTAVRIQSAEKELDIVWTKATAYAQALDKQHSGGYVPESKADTALASLIEAQGAWTSYRNKTCHMEFYKDPGQLSRVAEGECLEAMTKARIRGLKAFMEIN